jgi:general L-amino acid transport system permease protein
MSVAFASRLWGSLGRPVRAGEGAAITAGVALATGLAWLSYQVFQWGVIDAIWTLPVGTSSALCRTEQAVGACWPVIGERVWSILFGAYPLAHQWRPAVACLLLVGLFIVSASRTVRWKPLVLLWVLLPLTAALVLRGGIAGLPLVASDLWGGLPLTLLLSTGGFVGAAPLAVLLALGRRSQLPVIRALCVGFIELVRGVPFVTILFMASVMFPLFIPPGLVVDKVLRAQIAIVLVFAAYLAEVVRGGLQAIPEGQYEAAASVALPYWRATFLVILPQAIRITIPSIVNTFIVFFKDTSLIAIIGLTDLLGAAKAVLVDPKWSGFGPEVYLFAAVIYFVFSYVVSSYSQRLEQVYAVQATR